MQYSSFPPEGVTRTSCYRFEYNFHHTSSVKASIASLQGLTPHLNLHRCMKPVNVRVECNRWSGLWTGSLDWLDWITESTIMYECHYVRRSRHASLDPSRSREFQSDACTLFEHDLFSVRYALITNCACVALLWICHCMVLFMFVSYSCVLYSHCACFAGYLNLLSIYFE